MKLPLLSLFFVVLSVASCTGGDDAGGEGEGEAGEGEGEGEEGEGEEGEGEGEEGEGEEGEGEEGEGEEGEGEEGEGEEGEGEEGEGEDNACRTTDDCDQGSCQHPDAAPTCGIGPPDFPDECDANGEGCNEGNICDFIDDGCGGSHLGCVPFCEQDTCTNDDEACVSFRCELFACVRDDENVVGGYECPSHLACLGDNNPLADSNHGCVAIACAIDGDCLSGFCVNSTCAPSAGSCELPRP